MLKTTFTLEEKRPLTHDVWELQYAFEGECDILPWQYAMFQFEPWLSRAYSCSAFRDNTFTLIVKCLPEGRGSNRMCTAQVWDRYAGMLWLGHFTLRPNAANRCFIGTGTGFAPLYCQIVKSYEYWLSGKNTFLFGVRTENDIFYKTELEELRSFHENFSPIFFLSREEKAWYKHGYVTDWITRENIGEFDVFYICGSPEMVRSAREKLENLGISKEQIFFEQY